MSRRLLRKLVVENSVFVNGQQVRMSTLVSEGDSVSLQFPDEISSVEPENIPLDILYEDENVLVVNKPVNMLTHPSARERSGSLLAAAAFYLQPQGLVPHSIHRLDKYTSGAILIAKHAHAHHLFDQSLRHGLIHRHYVALVYSRHPLSLQQPFRLVDFIAQDPTKPSRRVIGDELSGQEALTDVEVVAAMPPVYVCRFRLETGRTHQIRLQMASHAMPLLGDRDYTYAYSGDAESIESVHYQRVIPHQALHAYELIWRTRLESTYRRSSAPVRSEMEELWTLLKGPSTLTELVSTRPFDTLGMDM